MTNEISLELLKYDLLIAIVRQHQKTRKPMISDHSNTIIFNILTEDLKNRLSDADKIKRYKDLKHNTLNKENDPFHKLLALIEYSIGNDPNNAVTRYKESLDDLNESQDSDDTARSQTRCTIS